MSVPAGRDAPVRDLMQIKCRIDVQGRVYQGILTRVDDGWIRMLADERGRIFYHAGVTHSGIQPTPWSALAALVADLTRMMGLDQNMPISLR